MPVNVLTDLTKGTNVCFQCLGNRPKYGEYLNDFQCRQTIITLLLMKVLCTLHKDEGSFGNNIRGSRGETGGPDPPPPLENHQNIEFLSNTGQDPLKKHKAAKPAFNDGRLRFADGPMMTR